MKPAKEMGLPEEICLCCLTEEMPETFKADARNDRGPVARARKSQMDGRRRPDLAEGRGGVSGDEPRLGRFPYTEKTEYRALVRATIGLTVPGTVMWFDNTFIGLLTKLGYDVSRTIYFREALHATPAIVVWHLHFVISSPDEHPVNIAGLTGTLSERKMAEEHLRELERFKKEAALAPEAPPAV